MPWSVADFKRFNSECELASLIRKHLCVLFVVYFSFSNQVLNCGAYGIAGHLDFICMKFGQK